MGRLVASGAEIERASAFQRIERHHHEGAYAALVLRGGYVEAGDRGRLRTAAGEVVFHSAFEGHFDCIADSGAEILNLSLSDVPSYALGRCADPDEVARAAEKDPAQAAQLLLAGTIPASSLILDWPDLLASDLQRHVGLRLDRWAADHRLSVSTVSRGFARAYGVSPKRFRLELRASEAARAIRSGARLGETAFATGFADQPHMTRTVSALFGRSPVKLRS